MSNSRKQFDQRAVVLAGLAASEGATFRPIHVQKLFFLIDQKIPDLIGGPYFTFRPYSYGPFDHAVYRVLERLEGEGAVEIIGDRWSPYRSYRLTEMGQVEGQDILSALPESAADYIRRLLRFVRERSFAELVSAIYDAYPEMRKNSVFVS